MQRGDFNLDMNLNETVDVYVLRNFQKDDCNLDMNLNETVDVYVLSNFQRDKCKLGMNLNETVGVYVLRNFQHLNFAICAWLALDIHTHAHPHSHTHTHTHTHKHIHTHTQVGAMLSAAGSGHIYQVYQPMNFFNLVALSNRKEVSYCTAYICGICAVFPYINCPPQTQVRIPAGTVLLLFGVNFISLRLLVNTPYPSHFLLMHVVHP